MNETLKRSIKSIIISLFIFAAFSVYLFARRGYFNLYIANKAFGSTAVILAGITLLLGPLSRKITSIAKYMTIRRQLGLMAFIYALIHVAASLLQQQRFPFPKWYLDEWLPISMGVIAVLIWGYLAYLSRDTKIQKMGGSKWIKHLSFGAKIAFVAVLLHLVVMKYPGWITWLSGRTRQTAELANPQYPPASLFVLIFILAVIAYRIFAYFRHK